MTTPISWLRKLDLVDCHGKGSMQNASLATKLLRGTTLSCIVHTEAGKWDHRLKFIEQVVTDMISHCPKNEPVVLISLGSDRLLLEYLIGKALLENGFHNISFFMIDPAYVTTDISEKTIMDGIRQDFLTNLGAVYSKTTKQKLEVEHVRFLSRAQNVGKYFPASANVVLIESLPPYGEPLKDFALHKLSKKDPEELFAGSRVTTLDKANAIAFIPKNFMAMMKKAGGVFTHSLPHGIYEFENSKYCIDWGCKLLSNGQYRLSFSGQEYFIGSIGIAKDRRIQFETGEVVSADQMIPTAQKAIEALLVKEIDGKPLSQENMSAILAKVQTVMTKYLPGVCCFYLVDYATDRAEMVSALSKSASHHYRKTFTLKADANQVFAITKEQIP